VSHRRSLLFAVAFLSLSRSLCAAWGTTNDTLVAISAWDFQSLNSSMTTSNGVTAAAGMRFMTGAGGELLAGVSVPANDFGFQFIEALAATGITGGCGGGNYCPDTRSPGVRRRSSWPGRSV
jgi:hypothetical protein